MSDATPIPGLPFVDLKASFDSAMLRDIRARCAQPVTEIVANPGEYYRVQAILRDRAELLRLLDECMAGRDARATDTTNAEPEGPASEPPPFAKTVLLSMQLKDGIGRYVAIGFRQSTDHSGDWYEVNGKLTVGRNVLGWRALPAPMKEDDK